jgi:hypothetical protein
MDILYNDLDEAVIRNGDFESEENTDFQHIRHILIGEMGEFRNAPLMGVGLRRWEKSAGNREVLRRRAKLQLEIDGYRVDRLDFGDENSEVIAERI